MTAQIIHHHEDLTRHEQIKHEASWQKFNYTLWPAIMHAKPCTGISKAHKQIVKWAKERGLPMVLIMEDDVSFTAPGAFAYFMENIPADFDLYLGGIYRGDVAKDNTVGWFSGLHCYIVHERFYDVFLSVREDDHIDKALWHKGKFVVCNPMVAKQLPGYSYNAGKEVDYEWMLDDYTFFTERQETQSGTKDTQSFTEKITS